jgi:hypothetical protein
MHIARLAESDVHMRKDSRRRGIAGPKSPHKLLSEETSLLSAILVRPLPSRARILFVALGSAAFESAVSEDSQAILIEFALLRETVRELEAIFEQMSRVDAPTPATEELRDGAPRMPPTQQRTARAAENSVPARR